jgi:hypothetical protein
MTAIVTQNARGEFLRQFEIMRPVLDIPFPINSSHGGGRHDNVPNMNPKIRPINRKTLPMNPFGRSTRSSAIITLQVYYLFIDIPFSFILAHVWD